MLENAQKCIFKMGAHIGICICFSIVYGYLGSFWRCL